MTRIDVQGWINTARARLSRTSDQPLLEAHALLGHALARPRTWLLAHPEAALAQSALDQADGLLLRLLTGEPLAYILGHQEFYGIEFEVSPAVLIPRPETELLLAEALHWLQAHPGRRRAAEAGVGSGCISAALATYCLDLNCAATDISPAALIMAIRNLTRLGLLHRTTLVCCDLLSALAGPFDLITANLPYIPTAKLASLPVTCHEPVLALDGGPTGLDLIARLLADVPRLLAPGGLLLLEVEAGHELSAPALTRQSLPTAQITLMRDLAGLPRLLRAEVP